MLVLALLSLSAFAVRAVEVEEFESVQYYTNVWAVNLDTDDPGIASEIAAQHGFTNMGKIADLPGYFKFVHESVAEFQENEAQHLTQKLLKHSRVNWVDQQQTFPREPRGLLPMDAKSIPKSTRELYGKHLFNDEYWPEQWYLVNYGQEGTPVGHDINVLPVWQRGYRGEGIVVSIVDQGVDHTHPDLRDNYDPEASFDFIDNDPDPFPSPSAAHGTECAGEVGAAADNLMCGVGITPRVNLGGIRFLGNGNATDILEAESVSFNRQYIDVYSNSWGPEDTGALFQKPKKLASLALETGAREGRGGKGSIYTWASGNGGAVLDNCNADGYSSSIYTISIASISPFGRTVSYGERCASIMAAIYSTGNHASFIERKSLVTTTLDHKCTRHFTGTSSATPLAAGVMALTLQANRELTWRDVQHLVVRTAKKTGPPSEWRQNAVGIKFHPMLGFGMLDAGAMVSGALNWTQVSEQRVCEVQGPRLIESEILPGGHVMLKVNTDACKGTASFVQRLEHVEVLLSLEHRRRGDLAVHVTSPAGTRSTVLTPRPRDDSRKGLKDWPFMTLHLWGENPAGEWTVVVEDTHSANEEKSQVMEETGAQLRDQDFTRKPPAPVHRLPRGAKLEEPKRMDDDLHYARFGIDYMEEVDADSSEVSGTEPSAAGRVLHPWKVVLYGTA